jgi:uncharacterized protein YjbJ (UPF0337 family)
MATEVMIERSHVEWSPVFAGALVAAALSSVLLTAGAALGLSLISAYPGYSYAKSAGTLAAAWSLIVTIGSFMLGGYIAGRMRSSWAEGGADEVAFRDGMHGFLVWSLGIVAGALLAMVATITTAQVGAQVAKTVAQGDTVLTPATDTLLRSSPKPPAGAASAGTAASPAAAQLNRGEVGNILGTAVANGQMNGNDRTYLAQALAQRDGISQAEAEKRVDAAFADAQRAAEQARKAAALTALLTVSALLISLAAAWYAAQRGGYNRDNNVWTAHPMVRRAQFSLRREQTDPLRRVENTRYNFKGDQANWNRVQGDWKQFSGKVKEKWGQLTDDDLAQINGNREQLEGKIQSRYGLAKDKVKNDVDRWVNGLK